MRQERRTAKLAKYPNVSIKFSGAAGNSLEPYPFRDMTVYLQRLIDAFGPGLFAKSRRSPERDRGGWLPLEDPSVSIRQSLRPIPSALIAKDHSVIR
jgi:hypothetical protein